ncbi:hypothetical protein QUF80_08365 [Desulfococcaceae bacterium HSG8]|nr:hypothetical protein [Desulfococcaceae bacterium HSG8]
MNRKIIMAILLVIGLLASGTAYADERGRGDRTRHGKQKSPMGHLMKCQKDNILAEVLSGITGQPAETIREELKTDRKREVLEKYNVDHETFRTAMDAKTVVLVQDALEDGRITQEQADDILDKMNNRPERPDPDSTPAGD